MDIFNILLVQPMINVLVAIYQGLMALRIPYALGFAIILFTAIVRLLANPLMKGMLKSQKKMQELAPELAKIKEKYKSDMRQQQLAQMELFKAKGVNPASGCLPLLVQFPLFIALYQALDKIVKAKSASDLNGMLYSESLRMRELWDTTFFGLPLGKSPSELLSSLGYAIVLVAVITGVLQLIQSKMTLPPASSLGAKDKSKQDDFATSLQKQMTYMVPVMIGAFAFTFPIGITLYWNTFTIFGIIQQYKISGLGGLKDWLKRKA